MPAFVLWFILTTSQAFSAPQNIPEDPHQSLHLFFQTDSSTAHSTSSLQVDLDNYIAKLERIKRRTNSEISFLRKAFYKTHKTYLHAYDAGATFPETLTTGDYGCLSGTALYAIILGHLGYNFEIIEMASHVYLKVHLADSFVLIESTLPAKGFVTDVREIDRMTQQYEEKSRMSNSIMAISGLPNDSAKGTLYAKSIDLTQLSGLQYYNMAIYNLGDGLLDKAYVNAQKSIDLYPSKRTEKLMEIVINKILQSKALTKDQKAGILNAYISQVKKKKLTQR